MNSLTTHESLKINLFKPQPTSADLKIQEEKTQPDRDAWATISEHPSPIGLYAKTIERKVEQATINSPEKFEQFLITLMNFAEKKGEHHCEALADQHKRKEQLIEELRKLNISIANDTNVAFWGTAQTLTAGLAVLVGFLALGAVPFGGTPATFFAILSAGAGFVSAWTSAIRFFFEAKHEKLIAHTIPLQLAHDINSEGLKKETEITSKSIEEWMQLASTLAELIKSRDNVKSLIVRRK